MLTVNEALATITREARPVVARKVALAAAAQAILAQSVLLDADSPPFDRAVVDGFALLAGDAAAGARFAIIGRQDAGGPLFDRPLAPGEALGINTGAPMPAGADAVVMVEHTRVDGHTLTFEKTLAPGQGMQKRAADAARGTAVLQPGQRLHAPQIALAAMAGAAEVLVRRARVAILATGDELVPISAVPGPGQIRNSNGPMMAELVRAAGGELLDLGTVGDHEPDVRDMLGRGLAEADLLLVSGGMSMGTRDLVPPLLKDLGVQFHIEKVRMKPGKPFLFGTRDDAAGRRYVAGLPGNPVSAFVTFHRFVRGILSAISAESGPADCAVEAIATTPLEPNGDREFYQPCNASFRNARLEATPLNWKGSADLVTLARANGLLVRESQAPAAASGAPVRVLML